MRRMILILVTVASTGFYSAQFNDLGVALFDYRDYQGQHFFITEDWTSDDADLVFGIESVRIPKGWEIWLYEGADFSGDHRALTSNWDGNGKRDWQWRNDIRSIRIITKFTPNPIFQSQVSTQGIAVFKRTDYRGEHKFITKDWTSEDGCFSYGIESIRVPSGWEIWIYEGDNFTGRHKKLSSDWRGTAKDDWMWRDDIRSIRIIRSNLAWNALTPERPKVRLYEDSEQGGQYFELSGQWSVIHSNDLWNDRISSIEIPPGVEVHVFEHSNFRGRVKILKRDWSIKDRGAFWNDRISSIRVFNEGYVIQ